MKNKHILFLTILLFFINNTSCKKDDHNSNDHEYVYRANLVLSSSSGNVTMSFDDPDGDGGLAPTIVGGTLKPNTTYTGSISLFTKHDSHYDDITSSIKNEATAHQFFYVSSLSGLTVEYTDKDANNLPLGVETKWTTTSAGSGKLKVVLRHEPNKSGTNVSTGDITNAGGETDVEVEFNVAIQ